MNMGDFERYERKMAGEPVPVPVEQEEEEGFLDEMTMKILRALKKLLGQDEQAPMPSPEELQRLSQGGKVKTPAQIDPNQMQPGAMGRQEERELYEQAMGIKRNLGGR